MKKIILIDQNIPAIGGDEPYQFKVNNNDIEICTLTVLYSCYLEMPNDYLSSILSYKSDDIMNSSAKIYFNRLFFADLIILRIANLDKLEITRKNLELFAQCMGVSIPPIIIIGTKVQIEQLQEQEQKKFENLVVYTPKDYKWLDLLELIKLLSSNVDIQMILEKYNFFATTSENTYFNLAYSFFKSPAAIIAAATVATAAAVTFIA